jgi:hypothetical protein
MQKRRSLVLFCLKFLHPELVNNRLLSQHAGWQNVFRARAGPIITFIGSPLEAVISITAARRELKVEKKKRIIISPRRNCNPSFFSWLRSLHAAVVKVTAVSRKKGGMKKRDKEIFCGLNFLHAASTASSITKKLGKKFFHWSTFPLLSAACG